MKRARKQGIRGEEARQRMLEKDMMITCHTPEERKPEIGGEEARNRRKGSQE